ncbi:hypothetical protein LXD69_02050 [Flavobacterium sediminilitoris]|uniref:ATP-GRASP peptide maturase of grasp-with-spasm system n=1 Tax=Flavobacterium sediminilitoris TaxID=2024526 RepID=A0ABY4HP03_9FLAO|nr:MULTISPECIES: hypothetical protein [Flavobacterium]UOX34310.1 hypothetical protein LXD69_02050 [Flavobacterium sediminilitoris]
MNSVKTTKKIVIQSDVDDRSTDDVIQWINYLSPNCLVETLFGACLIKDLKIEFSNENIVYKINDVSFTNKDSYWYRRGMFKLFQDDSFFKKSIYENSLFPVISYLDVKKSQNQINRFFDNKVGKLEQLEVCKKVGLKFPETLVTTSYFDLEKFVKKHHKIITKPIQNPFSKHEFEDYDVHFFTSTQLITSEDLNNNFPEKFQPSLFQKYTAKKFEIRSFYLNEVFYSMAIFSQQNEKTKIDYRNYDYEKPNRVIPFSIPKDIEEKLIKMMKSLDLTSGSFDLIYTLDNEYVFLEVNPIGQFQWLSRNCNYNIEKIIAKTLINE